MKKKKKKPTEKYILDTLKDWWASAKYQGDTNPQDPERLTKLRPSSLPFCVLKTAIQRIQDPEGLQTNSFESLFYVTIGSSVHSLLQGFVGRMAVENKVKVKVETLGHWKCLDPKCGAHRYFTTYKRCSCGSKMEYEEIELVWRNTIGHIDKVLRIGKYLILLDYKTAGSKKLWEHRMSLQSGNPKLPYKGNLAQIDRYIGLFDRVFKKLFKKGQPFYKHTLIGSVLAYIPRDAMSQPEFIWLPRSDLQKKRLYKEAIVDDAVFPKMLEVVKSPSLESLQSLVPYKKCKSYSDYEEKIKDVYVSCPMAEHCFNKKKRDKALNLVAKGKPLPKVKEMVEVKRSENRLRSPSVPTTF